MLQLGVGEVFTIVSISILWKIGWVNGEFVRLLFLRGRAVDNVELFLVRAILFLLIDFKLLIFLLQVLELVLSLVRQLINLMCDHGLEVGVFSFRRLELLMHDLESVRDRVVLSFQCTETCQDLVVNAFDQDNPVEWIELLLLKVLVPLFDLMWHLDCLPMLLLESLDIFDTKSSISLIVFS